MLLCKLDGLITVQMFFVWNNNKCIEFGILCWSCKYILLFLILYLAPCVILKESILRQIDFMTFISRSTLFLAHRFLQRF